MSPFAPHCVGEDTLHVVPLQQPFGHETSVHWHMPPTHCCPAAHGVLEPHWHCPEPQLSERRSQAVHRLPVRPHAATLVLVTQVLPWQQPLHDAASQTHVPPEQRCPG